jgi:hypothetical protein
LWSFAEDQSALIEGDPIYLMAHFLNAVGEGGVPSPKVLQWVAKAFNDWLCAQGEIPLERILGLEGESGRKSFKRYMRAQRDEALLMDVMQLLFAVDVSVIRACEMTCRRFEESYPEEFRQYPIEPSTLELKYQKAPWTGGRMRELFFGTEKPSDDEIAAFLSRFPADSVPRHLRIYLKKRT